MLVICVFFTVLRLVKYLKRTRPLQKCQHEQAVCYDGEMFYFFYKKPNLYFASFNPKKRLQAKIMDNYVSDVNLANFLNAVARVLF